MIFGYHIVSHLEPVVFDYFYHVYLSSNNNNYYYYTLVEIMLIIILIISISSQQSNPQGEVESVLIDTKFRSNYNALKKYRVMKVTFKISFHYNNFTWQFNVHILFSDKERDRDKATRREMHFERGWTY